eukprot:jgi/Mesvir1/27351/Mv07164-RA.1
MASDENGHKAEALQRQLSQKDAAIRELQSRVSELEVTESRLRTRMEKFEAASKNGESFDSLLAAEVAEARALVEMQEMERAAQAGALLAAEVAEMRSQVEQREKERMSGIASREAELDRSIAAVQKKEAELQRRMAQFMAQQSAGVALAPGGGSTLAIKPGGAKLYAAAFANLRSSLETLRLDVYNALKPGGDTYSKFQYLGKMVDEQLRRYKEVQAQNKKLHNEVLDLKGSIRVYLRVRPLLGEEAENGMAVQVCGEDSVTIKGADFREKRKFVYDHVFGPDATQDQVFEDTAPLIRSVMDGYNVCIFAYGQTGSGKTYTMMGPGDNRLEHLSGVNYRALGALFKIAAERHGEYDYSIRVEMVEIYNEVVRDLLAPQSKEKPAKALEMRAGEGGRLLDVTSVQVRGVVDVITTMNTGLRNRAVGATNLNEHSSRSHCVLAVRVEGNAHVTGESFEAVLNLVDLAGSERVSRSEATGDRLKEAQHINKSLSALGDVMAALQERRSHVPYRNSKLTTLLQDSLGGNSKVMMFAHVNPDDSMTWESVSTLNFASRVRTIELGRAVKSVKYTNEIKDLMNQVAQKEEQLRQEQARQLRQVQEGRNLTAAELEGTKSELQVLQSQLESRSRDLAQQSRELSIKENKLRENTKELGTTSRELAASQAKVASLTKELATAQEKLSKLSAQLNATTKELMGAQGEVRMLTVQLSRLEDKNIALTSKLEHASRMSASTMRSARATSARTSPGPATSGRPSLDLDTRDLSAGRSRDTSTGRSRDPSAGRGVTTPREGGSSSAKWVGVSRSTSGRGTIGSVSTRDPGAAASTASSSTPGGDEGEDGAVAGGPVASVVMDAQTARDRLTSPSMDAKAKMDNLRRTLERPKSAVPLTTTSVPKRRVSGGLDRPSLDKMPTSPVLEKSASTNSRAVRPATARPATSTTGPGPATLRRSVSPNPMRPSSAVRARMYNGASLNSTKSPSTGMMSLQKRWM